jgi:tetratricopeptide (TPR) repeat protein
MIRILLVTACFMLTAGTLKAGSVDDLKAATAAVGQAGPNETIGLFTKALAAGDLSPQDQFAARKGRAAEYAVKSLIDDSFGRLDQARDSRERAIADFTAALAIKTDDASVSIGRAQVYHLSGQYDQAIADFDAALKLNDSLAARLQRANSLRSKGDYDAAIDAYTAALGLDTKDAGLEGWEIYSERGVAAFLATRYDAAAADFEKALTIGAAVRTGDVLWIPYQVAWLHIARARAGQNDAEELARNAEKIDLKAWPGTLISFYLGRTTIDQLSPPSSHGAMGHGRECNLAFFAGQDALLKKDNAGAAARFQRARAFCNIHTTTYLAAGAELMRLGK